MEKSSLQKHIYKRFVANVHYSLSLPFFPFSFNFPLFLSFYFSFLFIFSFPFFLLLSFSSFLSFLFSSLFFSYLLYSFLFLFFSFIFLSLTFSFFLSAYSPPFLFSFSLSPFTFLFSFSGGRRKVQPLLQTVHSQSTGTAGTEENSVPSLPAWSLNNLDQLQSRLQESSASSSKGFVDVSHKQQNKQGCSGLAYLCSKHSS